MKSLTPPKLILALMATAVFIPGARADQVFLDDLIVDGSACIGLDCVNGESFGFDTLRLKENNLRIKFDDTSNSASFPDRDWQLTANDSSNGGLEKFSIDDISGGRTPFTTEGNAPSHSLYVDDGGRLGLGTNAPVVDVHVKSGNTPTLRLEQDGTSGFTPQTWDVAGNETNFFIRDATHGSTLPFRIFPDAPSNALNIEASGDIGIGDTSPDASLDIERSDGSAQILVEDTDDGSGADTLLQVTNGGPTQIRMTDTSGAGNEWIINATAAANEWRLSEQATGNVEMSVDTSGNVTAFGDFISGVTTLNVPDFVFEDTYELMPLDQLEEFIGKKGHLPEVPSASEVKQGGGLNMTEMQMKLLQKVEELTLYTLEQQKTIKQLQERLDSVEGK